MAAAADSGRGLSPGKALLFGTVTVGVLDILDAFIVAAIRGGSPVRVLQSIAAGLLGREAYAGGIPTAILGTALHFFIAGAVVTTYFLASRRLTPLTQRPFLYGPLYGLAVWAVMHQVVIPLSAITMGVPTPGRLLNALFIHAFGVGLPAALVARAAAPRGRSGAETVAAA